MLRCVRTNAGMHTHAHVHTHVHTYTCTLTHTFNWKGVRVQVYWKCVRGSACARSVCAGVGVSVGVQVSVSAGVADVGVGVGAHLCVGAKKPKLVLKTLLKGPELLVKGLV
jgi:hypothetical protein